MLSVFALRRRRDVAIEAASTTWLSMPFVLQRPVNPKPVETGLLYNDDPKALTRPQSRFLPKLCEALHQSGEIAAANRML